MEVHTYAHIHSYTYMYNSYRHACMHTFIHTCTHIHTDTRVHTHLYASAHTFIKTCMHAHIYIHMYTHMHMLYTPTFTCTFIHICAHITVFSVLGIMLLGMSMTNSILPLPNMGSVFYEVLGKFGVLSPVGEDSVQICGRIKVKADSVGAAK